MAIVKASTPNSSQQPDRNRTQFLVVKILASFSGKNEMGGYQRPHLNGRLEGGVSKGDPSAACCSRTRDTSLGLITSLSPFCLRGSASMLSSCGYQGLAALCHLCFCAVVDDHCLPPLFCNCYSFHLFRFIRHNRHIVSKLRCCRSDKGTPPDL